jgi:hypothetical protein
MANYPPIRSAVLFGTRSGHDDDVPSSEQSSQNESFCGSPADGSALLQGPSLPPFNWPAVAGDRRPVAGVVFRTCPWCLSGYACSREGRGTSNAMTAPAARNAAPTGSAAVSPAANDDGVA